MENLNQELAIIIPAKNEERYLGILLDSILDQDYPLISQTPVIIADAGSTDRTREIALSYAYYLPIKIVKGGLPSRGRNAGAKNSQSDYLLFVDADIELADRGIVRRALEIVKKEGLHCATTNIYCREGNFLDNFLYRVNNFAQKVSQLEKPYATGMFMFFKRDIFNQLGGFDERVKYGEDYFLTKRLERSKFGIVPGYILTTNRRFQRMGYFRRSKIFLNSLLHRRNDQFFINYKADNYWDW